MQDFIKINKDDNVAVALKPIAKGTTVNVAGTEVTTVEDIPQGHKFVIKEIKNGDPVIKYGFRIGFAQADIPVGAWVHTHNLKTGLGELLEYTYEPEGHKDVEPTEPAYFDGYMRENGKVGVRNEVWIVPTVGCVNSIARAIEATARMNKPEGVDEVVAFTHPYGCSQTTEDQENTRKILADLINHPNAGAVLVLGLGCENSCLEMESNMYLEIKNISKTIKGNRVLDDISASMECGKIYGFRGQNGSGKTMLMRCICGLVIPDNGAIIVDGDELGKRISFPESLGALIESPGFIEHYSALDNMRAIASIKGIALENEMREILQEVGLDPDEKKSVKKYSLGMRQKLGIAIALMENPELIILDEPFNALDEKSVEKVKKIIKQRAEAGALIIVSCHDREILDQIADSIYYMEEGKIIRNEKK